MHVRCQSIIIVAVAVQYATRLTDCVCTCVCVCVCVVDPPRLHPVVTAAGAGGSGSAAVLRDGQVSVHENATVNMTCEVDAVPSASTSALNWYRNGSLVHTGQYYVMSAVQRRDAGKYLCQTSNIMTPSQRSSQIGIGRAEFHLVVMCKKTSSFYFITSHTHTHTQRERERERER